MVVRLRAVLALVLVVLTTFLVSCSSGPKVKGPLYSEAQLAEIRTTVTRIAGDRDRLEELVPLIEGSRWNDVRTFIHGPLGELGPRMSRLARKLAPEKVQKQALKAVDEVLGDLNAIDSAAAAKDVARARTNYNAAARDLDALLDYAPADAS